jgi:hypothetical protein
MADPKGNLVTPVAFNPSGYPLALEVDANGYLKVATAAAGNFLVGTHGYVSGAWKKNPILFGYSSGLFERNYNPNLSAGTNYLSMSTVPADWIWIVTQVSIFYAGTSPEYIDVSIVHSGLFCCLFKYRRPVSSQFYDRQGWWVLEAGDSMYMSIVGATAGDDALLVATGFKVQLAA